MRNNLREAWQCIETTADNPVLDLLIAIVVVVPLCLAALAVKGIRWLAY